MKTFEIHNADCREVMKSLPANSIDSIVTDPPYGLEFMGKGWDRGVPGVEFWTEALRVLKPGGHLLAFGGTRTFHRLTVAIEDSGFEIRDCLGWIYGSGFPKSHNISKAIDRAAGAEREIVGVHPFANRGSAQSIAGVNLSGSPNREQYLTAPATPEAAEWAGWGTALKPAWEPIILARKPLAGTVAENVLEFRTGGLNIDAARISGEPTPINKLENWSGFGQEKRPNYIQEMNTAGRWPANILHDGSEEAIGIFPEDRPGMSGGGTGRRDCSIFNSGGISKPEHFRNDNGSAARFFYCAKASKADREAGNIHPTVKPSALMRYLCRLVTAPGGLILDPFAGSGSTGKAAIAEGFRFLGAELDPAYAEIARARCQAAAKIAPEITKGAEDSAQLHLFGEG